MTRTATPPQTTTSAALTPLQAVAAEYIARHGIHAFMDDDYNLTGTRARAVVRPENAALAAELGVPVAGRELPVAIDKKEVWGVLEGARRQSNREQLAAFFADPANAPGLIQTQRMYLEWHYRSPNTYRLNLEKPWRGGPAVARIMGWNMETQSSGDGGEDFVFYTGLLGCTGVCAVAADGTCYFSHWDEVCNPRQFDGYARFAQSHPGGRVHVVGAVWKDLVAAVRQRHPGLDVVYHVKRIYFETTYMVRFSRLAGKVEVAFQESEVCDDYVESCHHGEYGRWFPYGRFSQAFPGPEETFVPCRFERMS